MSQIPTNFFKGFLELPIENRLFIVDSMLPDDRLLSDKLSVLSRTKTKRLNVCVQGLKLCGFIEDYLSIYVWDEYGAEKKHYNGFILEFRIEKGLKYIKFLDLDRNEAWRVQLCSSTDLFHYSAEHFRKMLKIHQNVIKTLKIELSPKFENKTQNLKFEVEGLHDLEVLVVLCGFCDVSQFLSKLRKPLKYLSIYGKISDEMIETFAAVQQTLIVPSFNLNYDKFLQLAASKVSTPIGEMTEKDIHSYIKLWQRGKTGKEVECYDLYLKDSGFDILKLLGLLGEKKPESEEPITLFIEHNFKKGRKAMLFYDSNRLTFAADLNRDWSDSKTDEKSSSKNDSENKVD